MRLLPTVFVLSLVLPLLAQPSAAPSSAAPSSAAPSSAAPSSAAPSSATQQPKPMDSAKAAQSSPEVPTPSEAPKPKLKPRVRLQTSYGPIVLELEPELAPKTVENFLVYVKEGFYNGTIFHRVIRGVVVQGGGLKEDMTEKPTHPPVFNEARQVLEAGLKNTTGTLAMARGENPHSGAAQFFINVGDNPSFDPHGPGSESYGYCVFGHVVEGMEAVTKIEKVQVVWRKGFPCVPEYAVRIKSAELLPTAAVEAATPAGSPALPTAPSVASPAGGDKPNP